MWGWGTAGDDPGESRFELDSAANLPLEDGWADVIVSGLVLNFLPDLAHAVGEMRRVAKPGATIAGYVWDYAGEMQLIRMFWDAAVAVDPTATTRHEGARFPVCAPEPLRCAFEGAGLANVEVRSIEVPTVFRDLDDCWAPFLTGVAPAPGYAAALDDASRSRLRERLRATLPTEGDGSIHLTARAWAVRGQTPEAAATASFQRDHASGVSPVRPAPRGRPAHANAANVE